MTSFLSISTMPRASRKSDLYDKPGLNEKPSCCLFTSSRMDKPTKLDCFVGFYPFLLLPIPSRQPVSKSTGRVSAQVYSLVVGTPCPPNVTYVRNVVAPENGIAAVKYQVKLSSSADNKSSANCIVPQSGHAPFKAG